MAEVLVVGKKISEMDLVTDIVGDEKIPTGVVGDKAVTTGQLLTYLDNNGKVQWGRIEGDIANQADLQNQFSQQLATLQNHIQDQENPHNVTKEQVGLGLADNTADMDKPVSTAVQEALSLKADQTYVDDSLANKTHNSLLGRDADGAHPASAILDVSGLNQQQINDLTLTPFHFGAIGDGAHHPLSERYSTLEEAQVIYPHAESLSDSIDWAAIQKCFNVARDDDINGRKYDLDVSGNFSINKGLKYITRSTAYYAGMRVIRGDTLLNINFEGEYALKLHGRGIAWSGVLTIPCARKIDYGVIVSSPGTDSAANYINFGIKLDRCFIDSAKIWGVYFADKAMFSYLEFIRSGNCGVTSNIQGVGVQMSATPSNFVNTEGPLGGLGVITVDVLPDIEISQANIYVDYNGLVSRVTEIDRNQKTIKVVPLLPQAADTSLKLNYIYGGCVGMYGPDTAGVVINQMSAFGCGHALFAAAQYPCQVNYLCSEFSGIAINDQSLVSGANISTAYFEGDKWNLVNRKQTGDAFGSINIAHSTGLEFSKILDISFGRNLDGTSSALYAGMRGASVVKNNIKHQMTRGKLPKNIIPNGVENLYSIDFNTPHQNKVYKANSTTIGFTAIDPSSNSLFAYDSQEFTVMGTGSSGEPTGSITFSAPAGYTVNGASTAVFSGFASVAHFVAFLNVSTKDIQVSCTSLIKNDLSAGSEIPTSVTNLLNIPNGRYYFRSTSTVVGIPMPTTNAANNGNVNTYFSFAKVGETHRKTQEVEYPDLFEKWMRVYSSSSGSYGAWKLTSYEIKKGTTAQRPANPQIGMKYYDTTLLATGKPIEWNGSAWVDMTGTAV